MAKRTVVMSAEEARDALFCEIVPRPAHWPAHVDYEMKQCVIDGRLSFATHISVDSGQTWRLATDDELEFQWESPVLN